MKKNTPAEKAYVRDLEQSGSLQKVERGEARILTEHECPAPIKRFLRRSTTTSRQSANKTRQGLRLIK